MKPTFYLWSILFCCFFNTIFPLEDVFIQIRLQTALFKTIQEAIKPKIDAIICEELGIPQDDVCPGFLLKGGDLPLGRQDISLYYVLDLQPNSDSEVVNALDTMQKKGRGIRAPEHCSFSTAAEFFGDEKNELVIFIEDPKKELSNINAAIKKYMHRADHRYAKKHKGQKLYDIQKSEQYAYKPHIAIGRFMAQKIKALAPKGQEESIMQKIKMRVQQEVFPLLAKIITPHNKHIEIDGFLVNNIQKKPQTIKTYSFYHEVP